MNSFRVCAALLSYPEPDLIAALPELVAVLDEEQLLDRRPLAELQGLIEELQSRPLTASQENYVALFDRSRALSLHLFEHVHGESRDRGQAMVDLAETYRGRGMDVAGNELPDFLPVFLEFASLLPVTQARGLLGEAADVLRALGEHLAARGSRYAAVFSALLAIAGASGLKIKRAERPQAGPEDMPEAIDRAWMDEPVTFGGAHTPPIEVPDRAGRSGPAEVVCTSDMPMPEYRNGAGV